MKKAPHPVCLGHLHFVTANTHKRIPLFRSPVLCREFFTSLSEIKIRFPFELFAYVLMPDHFHLLVRPSDGDISRLVQKIKSLTARRVIDTLQTEGNDKSLLALRKPIPGRRAHSYQVFQQSFRDLRLWSSWMIHQKIDYIHANPVNEGLVDNVAAYRWSSCRAMHERTSEPIPIDHLPD